MSTGFPPSPIRSARRRGERIARRPFGQVLLIAVTAGLAGYSIWRPVRAAIGHGTQERDGTLDRVAGLVRGIAYAALCVTALDVLAGSSGRSASGSPKTAAGGVLGWR